ITNACSRCTVLAVESNKVWTNKNWLMPINSSLSLFAISALAGILFAITTLYAAFPHLYRIVAIWITLAAGWIFLIFLAYSRRPNKGDYRISRIRTLRVFLNKLILSSTAIVIGSALGMLIGRTMVLGVVGEVNYNDTVESAIIDGRTTDLKFLLAV